MIQIVILCVLVPKLHCKICSFKYRFQTIRDHLEKPQFNISISNAFAFNCFLGAVLLTAGDSSQ